MNHLKQLILTSTVTFFGFKTFSQTNEAKYIEVTATDSSQVSPDVIEYSFTLTPDNSSETAPVYTDDDYNNPPATNYAETQKKKQEEAMLKLKILEKRFTELLSKEKINYSRKDENSYNKYGYAGYDYEYGYGYGDVKNKAFIVRFGSFDQLDKFLAKVPEDIKYNGRISTTSSSKIREQESALLEKTVLKAKKQAETVARISGATLGSVLQFSDIAAAGSTSTNAGYDQLVNYLSGVYKGAVAQDDQRKIILTKTVRIRYAIQ